MPKPCLLLLDANIIIETHVLGCWDKLVAAVAITVPSTVAAEEARTFVDSRTGVAAVRLRPHIEQGLIREEAATPAELADLVSQFTADRWGGLHTGELEAIALLAAGRLPEHRFCTGDGAAIEALGILGLSEQGISLEELLSTHGLGRRLRRQYSQAFFRDWLRTGQQNRITGSGLAPASRYRLDKHPRRH